MYVCLVQSMATKAMSCGSLWSVESFLVDRLTLLTMFLLDPAAENFNLAWFYLQAKFHDNYQSESLCGWLVWDLSIQWKAL